MVQSKRRWEIEYYEQKDGRQPAEEFEDSIPAKLAGKLARIAVSLKEQGPQVGGGLIEKCHAYSGLWEMRAIFEKNLGREFFGFDQQRVVLLDGIMKRVGQPTATAALVRAARYWQDYLTSRKVSPEVKENGSV